MIKGKYFIPVFLCIFLTGCAGLVVFGAGTAAGVAGYKYYEGALIIIYEAPYIKTWDATLKAFENMKIPIQEKKQDLNKGKIKGKMSDGSTVTVSLEYKSSEQTEVVIRVGLLGNKEASTVIKDNIRRELFPK